MKIKDVTAQQLFAIVRQISHDEYGDNITFKREPETIGNFVFFTLTVNNSRESGARRSHTSRRIAAACWHAHRDVMLELFKQYPEALLVTALARYEGETDFLDKFDDTGYQNIGSQFQPCQMRDACDCDE